MRNIWIYFKSYRTPFGTWNNGWGTNCIRSCRCCCCCLIYLKLVKYTEAQIYLQFKYIITNQNRLILNVIVKTGILNFYCRYLSIKKPNCKSVRYNKHGIKNCTKSRQQYFVIINKHPKVVHPGRISSPRFAFERQSLSFYILCCNTNFAIAPCTVPLFNYHYERLMVFGGFHMVRQTVPNFRSKDSQIFASKYNLAMHWYIQIQHIFFSNKSTSFS